MESGRRAVLTLRGVSKSFGGLRAVIDVDLDLYEGEVLAIVGDNGAGKSTLIKILTGVHRADSGEIRIDGEKAEITSRRDSIDAGIEAVYQNLGLVNSLPAPANVFLGQEPVWRVMGVPFIDNRTMRRETERILRERVGIVLENLDDPVHNYSGGQRQAVAIARAIFNTELRVLVLDEPTAALGPQETRKTLELIRGIKERGIAVILISHNLENVFSVADRVQVMRGGRSAGVVEVAKSTRKEVLGLIVGSEDVAADAYA
ncbi:ATP-binding cassette domain-containing protein [Nitratireductor sp. GCM10026969]|uniref:ATP-binding cassette domain-containing protein n=1 Tax=Nitratireductor sp. GCM10026969 TaxID=3252645 RepID=UPI00360EDA18